MPPLKFVVRLTPKGGRDAVDGWSVAADGARVLKARVRAAPEDGAANEALVRLLAKSLGVAPSRLAIARGAAARLKQIEVRDADDAVAARLDELGTAS